MSTTEEQVLEELKALRREVQQINTALNGNPATNTPGIITRMALLEERSATIARFFWFFVGTMGTVLAGVLVAVMVAALG